MLLSDGTVHSLQIYKSEIAPQSSIVSANIIAQDNVTHLNHETVGKNIDTQKKLRELDLHTKKQKKPGV